jgi:glutamate-1-semialdehyde 2,1-aminomutase
MSDIRNELIKRTPKSKQLQESSSEVLAAEVVQTVDMPHPFYVAEANGARIVDVDGNEYIDLAMGYGPHVLGHAPESVVDAVREQAALGLQVGLHNPQQERLARLITEAAPANEQVIFANSGTEATMYAIRAARAYTGKMRVGLFDGNYHGVHDTVLAQAHGDSPRERPAVVTKSTGVPQETLDGILMLPYRHEAAFDLIREHRDELAVVLLEPVQSSNPRLDATEWMREVREVCRQSDVLFVLDEVITGFRLAFGGAHERFGVTPDLATYGKAIGGGMPVGAVAGPKELMAVFGRGALPPGASEDDEDVKRIRIYAGTTFAGNPMTMVAGAAQVGYLKEHRDEVYPYLDEQSDRLAKEVNGFIQVEELPALLMHASSMFHLRFGRGPVESSRDLDHSFAEVEREFYLHLLNRGVIVPGIHLFFLSAAHTPEDVDTVIDAFKQSFADIKQRGLV